METLIDCFDWHDHEVISLVGSGGKTSLSRYLSEKMSSSPVLVSTTTKMGYPLASDYDYFYQDHFEKIGREGCGITLAGEVLQTGNRTKITYPTVPNFSQYFSKFSKVILEADGSKQLPLKGWADFEPVILPETTVTIGILPINVLGKPTTEQVVHRLPLYLEMIEVQVGGPILPKHLAQIISSPVGLFKNAKGRCIVYFSQVDTAEKMATAQQVVAEIASIDKGRIEKIIAGDVFADSGVVLWQK